MTIPEKSLTSGFAMPVFGLGTWRMGGDARRDPGHDDATEIAAIRAAIDQGITHIDTAELYADGHAEELIATAIKGYNRNTLFLVSKVLAQNLAKNDVRAACERSLCRLGTDYLDLYLVHFPSETVPLEETMTTLNQLADEGKIKHIGVSNFTLERMKQAQAVSKRKLVATQVHYNLIYREPERAGLLRYCQDNDMLLIAWRPVEKGALSNQGIPIVDELGKKYGKTPAQIAINWLISQKNVVTLSKMSHPQHLTENLGALGWTMDAEDVERLRTDFPDQQSRSSSVPLT